MTGRPRASRVHDPRAFPRRVVVVVLLPFVLAVVAGPAFAHVIGISRGDYTPSGAQVRAELVLRADDAMAAVPGLDTDGDGRVSEAEVARGRSSLNAAFLGALEVRADDARCVPELQNAALDPPDGLRLRGTYACARAPRTLHLRFGFLEGLPAGHRHLATVHLPGGDVDTLAVLARPEFDVAVSSGASHGFLSLLRGGIEHILTGTDHLAFLLALVLGGTLVLPANQSGTGERPRARVAPLVAMLTAFTVGHSASLAIATLGGFAPPARFVEPVVALSVAYVGAENLFARNVSHRWMLTLPFGVVHGFAFAGGLLGLGLPRAQLPAALFAFNLGVEAGQLAVLALLLPPLALFCTRAWYPLAARIASCVIAVAGLVWFFRRVA